MKPFESLALAVLLLALAAWCGAILLDAFTPPHHLIIRDLTLVLCCLPYGLARLINRR